MLEYELGIAAKMLQSSMCGKFIPNQYPVEYLKTFRIIRTNQYFNYLGTLLCVNGPAARELKGTIVNVN